MTCSLCSKKITNGNMGFETRHITKGPGFVCWWCYFKDLKGPVQDVPDGFVMSTTIGEKMSDEPLNAETPDFYVDDPQVANDFNGDPYAEEKLRIKIVKTEKWYPDPNAVKEGEIVRYFRHPCVPGESRCPECSLIMHEHGWIDSGGDGQTVCPGDLVLTTNQGTYLRAPPLEKRRQLTDKEAKGRL